MDVSAIKMDRSVRVMERRKEDVSAAPNAIAKEKKLAAVRRITRKLVAAI